jgi:hypothetical protein
MAADGESPKPDEPVYSGGAARLPSDMVDESITAAEFHESFGEDIRRTLDLSTWRSGSDLVQEYDRIEREVREAAEHELGWQQEIRRRVFPVIETRRDAPKNAGVYRADQDLIRQVHNDLLFCGGVEACDGAIQVHDTLPLTIFQIGVTLVSYSGDQGTWAQRLFRRDLKQSGDRRDDDVIALLERRSERARLGSNDSLGELVQKALLDYAERAILLKHSKTPWRMGHGNPITYELLTGGGNLELMVEATNVMRQLVDKHQKFAFVAHEPGDQMLLTIGQALRPTEYAIVSTLDERLEHWLQQKRYKAQVGKQLT